jgi:thiamine-monophosphate kinase
LADAGHIAHASQLAVRIERESVPLSAAAKRVLATEPSLWANVVGGGDDYELVIAVPPRKTDALNAAARVAKVTVTRIGGFVRGQGVELTVAGRAVRAPRKGYVHF